MLIAGMTNAPVSKNLNSTLSRLWAGQVPAQTLCFAHHHRYPAGRAQVTFEANSLCVENSGEETRKTLLERVYSKIASLQNAIVGR
jgi:hypothetical protein